jgi:hypothetical protein
MAQKSVKSAEFSSYASLRRNATPQTLRDHQGWRTFRAIYATTGPAHSMRAIAKLAQEEDKQRKTAQESNSASEEKKQPRDLQKPYGQPFRERAATIGERILTPFRSCSKHKPRISKEDIRSGII